MGGMGAAERTLQTTTVASAEAETNWKEHVTGKRSSKGKGKGPGRTQAPTAMATTSWTGTVRVTQKAANIDKFDPLWALFRSGAHMPLIVFVGNNSRRSKGALEKREEKASDRGWGPESPNRSKLMQKQGYGPRPGEVRRQERAQQERAQGGTAPAAPADAGWSGSSSRWYADSRWHTDSQWTNSSSWAQSSSSKWRR